MPLICATTELKHKLKVMWVFYKHGWNIRPLKLFKWKAKRSALVNVSTGKFRSSQNKVRFGRTDRSDRVNAKRSMKHFLMYRVYKKKGNRALECYSAPNI